MDPTQCGVDGPLVAMPVPAVHSGLVWSEADWEQPKLLVWTRHADMRGTDIVDRGCLRRLILGSYPSWPILSADWRPTFVPNNDVDLSNPFRDSDSSEAPPGTTFDQCLRSSFKQLMAGGHRLRQGLSQSVAQRIEAYLDRELTQIWKLGRADALDDGEVFHAALLDEHDATRNLGSFEDAGYSRNLHYDIYGSGHSTLADGRVATIGGHNMNSNNGYRKINLYDPEVERWESRPEPCLRENWRDDRYGRKLGYRAIWETLVNPPATAPIWANCSPRARDSSDPQAPSDMRYPRWYPTSIVMPNGMVLILSGTDQDESVGPDLSIDDRDQRDAGFRATKIYQAVPEVFNPVTGATVALESARRRFPLHPQATVVQTGPKPEDWKVCALGGFAAPADQASTTRNTATNPAAQWRQYCTKPGCDADNRAIRFAGPYPAASLDCLDVQAALADTNRNIPAEDHWQTMVTATDSHDYCCPVANMLELGTSGVVERHEWLVFGGKQAKPSATIEGIDFAQSDPQWNTLAALYQPNSGADAMVLPNGKILIVGGRADRQHEDAQDQNHDQDWNLQYQIFDPATDQVRTVSRTNVPRGLHGTAVLLPDATVVVMGHDRHRLVQAGDDVFPPGDGDLGVSNGSVYYPPYLFDKRGNAATRPAIVTGPDRLRYAQDFTVELATGAPIRSVVLIRTDFVTHTLNTGTRYVKLSHAQTGKTLSLRAPKASTQAPPGDYMLFVVDDQGVPSHAKHVRIGTANPGPNLVPRESRD